MMNDDDLELIAEHPALKIAFLLSCSASHSSNPLVNRYHYNCSRDDGDGDEVDDGYDCDGDDEGYDGDGDIVDDGHEDTCPPGQEGQQTDP